MDSHDQDEELLRLVALYTTEQAPDMYIPGSSETQPLAADLQPFNSDLTIIFQQAASGIATSTFIPSTISCNMQTTDELYEYRSGATVDEQPYQNEAAAIGNAWADNCAGTETYYKLSSAQTLSVAEPTPINSFIGNNLDSFRSNLVTCQQPAAGEINTQSQSNDGESFEMYRIDSGAVDLPAVACLGELEHHNQCQSPGVRITDGQITKKLSREPGLEEAVSKTKLRSEVTLLGSHDGDNNVTLLNKDLIVPDSHDNDDKFVDTGLISSNTAEVGLRREGVGLDLFVEDCGRSDADGPVPSHSVTNARKLGRGFMKATASPVVTIGNVSSTVREDGISSEADLPSLQQSVFEIVQADVNVLDKNVASSSSYAVAKAEAQIVKEKNVEKSMELFGGYGSSDEEGAAAIKPKRKHRRVHPIGSSLSRSQGNRKKGTAAGHQDYPLRREKELANSYMEVEINQSVLEADVNVAEKAESKRNSAKSPSTSIVQGVTDAAAEPLSSTSTVQVVQSQAMLPPLPPPPPGPTYLVPTGKTHTVVRPLSQSLSKKINFDRRTLKFTRVRERDISVDSRISLKTSPSTTTSSSEQKTELVAVECEKDLRNRAVAFKKEERRLCALDRELDQKLVTIKLADGRIARREHALRDVIKGLEYREKALKCTDSEVMSHTKNAVAMDISLSTGVAEPRHKKKSGVNEAHQSDLFTTSTSHHATDDLPLPVKQEELKKLEQQIKKEQQRLLMNEERLAKWENDLRIFEQKVLANKQRNVVERNKKSDKHGSMNETQVIRKPGRPPSNNVVKVLTSKRPLGGKVVQRVVKRGRPFGSKTIQRVPISGKLAESKLLKTEKKAMVHNRAQELHSKSRRNKIKRKQPLSTAVCKPDNHLIQLRRPTRNLQQPLGSRSSRSSSASKT